MEINEVIEDMARDLREIRDYTARKEKPFGGWISIADCGYPEAEKGTDCTIDVLLGTVIYKSDYSRVFVVGWGYYSHTFEKWYIACDENFPRRYRATQENVTHYLIVPRYTRG